MLNFIYLLLLMLAFDLAISAMLNALKVYSPVPFFLVTILAPIGAVFILNSFEIEFKWWVIIIVMMILGSVLFRQARQSGNQEWNARANGLFVGAIIACFI